MHLQMSICRCYYKIDKLYTKNSEASHTIPYRIPHQKRKCPILLLIPILCWLCIWNTIPIVLNCCFFGFLVFFNATIWNALSFLMAIYFVFFQNRGVHNSVLLSLYKKCIATQFFFWSSWVITLSLTQVISA